MARFSIIAFAFFMVVVTANADKQPSFESKEGVHKGVKSQDVVLPCRVQNLGDYGVIWARETVDAEPESIFVDRQKMLEGDTRFELVSNEAHDSENWDMRIKQIEAYDHGYYQCRVTTEPEMIQRQMLEVRVPPTVNMVPEKSPYVVEAGSLVTITCYPSGNPKPKVTWTRTGGPLPSGQASIESSEIHFENVSKLHEGVYKCTADNGVGASAESEITLQINSDDAVAHPPRVTTDERKMLVRVAEAFNISCKYMANPPPHVEWFFNGYPLEPKKNPSKEHFKIEQISRDNSAITTIIVVDATVEDFGDYTCRIVNNLGKAEATIFVTGLPTEVKLDIRPGRDGKILLYWNVDSIEPILEYQLDYRIVKTVDKSLFTTKFLKPEKVAMPISGFTYEDKYPIPDTEPDSTYEIMMKARNKNGWGRTTQAMFNTGPLVKSQRQSDGLTSATKTQPNKGCLSKSENLLLIILLICFTLIKMSSLLS